MKTITVTVKDDAKPVEIDAFVDCIKILSGALRLDAVIVYEEKDIPEDEDAAQ